MKCLLDTHAFVWWTTLELDLIGSAARASFADHDNVFFVSAVSVYEIAYKHGRGRWPEVSPLVAAMDHAIVASNLLTLSLDTGHAVAAGLLPVEHRDPFDRMIAAQALVEDATLISNDTGMDRFGVRRLWD